MELLAEISNAAHSLNLRFIIVGGHAVNAYGVGRQTADLDLLIPQPDLEEWKKLLEELGYRLIQQHEQAFAQFAPLTPEFWPVDLILVDMHTYETFDHASEIVNLDGAEVRVPSALHLIALKLHALKQVGIIRELQDLPDIVALIGAAGIDVDADAFQAYCVRYGSETLYQKIRSAARAGRGPE